MKHNKTALLSLMTASVIFLTGCSNGIGDTFKVAKDAEKVKRSVEQMANLSRDEENSVGTIATGQKSESKSNAITELEIKSISFEDIGGECVLTWDITSPTPALRIQVFLDTDEAGYDGIEVETIETEDHASSKALSIAEEMSGTYYCYIKATDDNETTGKAGYAIGSVSLPITDTNKEA